MAFKKSDCLFLIVGTNPFPNLVAALTRLKRGGTVCFFYTEGSDFSATKKVREDLELVIDEVTDKVINAKNKIVLLEGKLVDINANNGQGKWWNQTSLSRSDSGDGACEIMYVEKLILDGQEYR